MSHHSRTTFLSLALTVLMAAAHPGMAASEAAARAEGPGFAATPT